MPDLTDAALWGVGGLLHCAAELLAPGVFLLWIGLAACAAGLLTTVFGLGGAAQIVAFVLLALMFAGGAAWRLRHRPAWGAINTPAAGLIGANCTALSFRAGEGRVSLRDGTWQARIAAPPDPTAGDTLRVIGLDGTTLLVDRLT